MKTLSLSIFICLVWSVKAATPAEPRLSDTVLIEDVTILSSHLGQPQYHMDVLIQNGRIDRILETGTNPPTDNRIDGSGKFLMPGLIDSHVHLAHNPMVNREDESVFDALDRAYRLQLPRSLLYHGFTTVIDLDYAPDRNGWLPDSELVPEVYHCGRGVRFAGGYGPAFVPPQFVHRVFPNLVYEPKHKAFWPDGMDPELYTIEAAVDRVVRSGAICLKTYVETGFGGVFKWASPSAETLSALAMAAHENGLVFVVHANSAQAWQMSVDAGADVIAHGMWHWDGNRRRSELTDAALSAIQNAVAAGVAVQPTVQVVIGEKETLTGELLQDPRTLSLLPPGLSDYLQSAKGRWSQRALLELYEEHNPFADTKPETLIGASIDRALKSMLRFHRSGGVLLMGSDTPAQDGIGNLPGLNGYLEMLGWAKAGIPLDRIFWSVTLGNAKEFHIDDEVGSVEPGKQADLLLLNMNPLQNVSAYNDIVVVIVDGSVIKRRDLSAR